MAAMACLTTPACLCAAPTAPLLVRSITISETCIGSSSQHLRAFVKRSPRLVVLKAGNRTGVEPDLEEDFRDVHQTAGEDMEDLFPFGKADGAHTWHEGDDGTWWDGIKEVFETSGGPVGAQGKALIGV
uniref:Uncharacterized protein n=1 Tax=Physcomitrium patens TaxID=3218 RepID=A0A7I4C6K0_PHYPA